MIGYRIIGYRFFMIFTVSITVLIIIDDLGRPTAIDTDWVEIVALISI